MLFDWSKILKNLEEKRGKNETEIHAILRILFLFREWHERVPFYNGLVILPRNFSKNRGKITSVYFLPRNLSAGYSKITFMVVA